jgi:hypothetical protein
MFEITEDAEVLRGLQDVWQDLVRPTLLLDALGWLPKQGIVALEPGQKHVVGCIRPEGPLECTLRVETVRSPSATGAGSACLAIKLEFYVPTGTRLQLPALKYFVSLQLAEQGKKATRLVVTLEAQGTQLKRKLVQTTKDERAEVMRPTLKTLLTQWKVFSETIGAAPYR